MPDLRGIPDMGSPAQFHGFPKAHRSYPLPVFLSEQGNGPLINRFVQGYIPLFFQRDLFPYPIVDKVLDLPQLFIGQLAEMGEIKSEIFRMYRGSFLLHMVP